MSRRCRPSVRCLPSCLRSLCLRREQRHRFPCGRPLFRCALRAIFKRRARPKVSTSQQHPRRLPLFGRKNLQLPLRKGCPAQVWKARPSKVGRRNKRPAQKRARPISLFPLSVLCVRPLVAVQPYIRLWRPQVMHAAYLFPRVLLRLRRKPILPAPPRRSLVRVSLYRPKRRAPTIAPCSPWSVHRVPRRPLLPLRRNSHRASVKCPPIWWRPDLLPKLRLHLRRLRPLALFRVRLFLHLRALIRRVRPLALASPPALPLPLVRKARAT